MSAVALVLGASAALATPAHADGPLGNSLDGLNQLQGIEFGDLSGILDHQPTAAPPPAPPPLASTIESPAIPTTGTQADAPSPAAVQQPAPTGGTQRASLQLPATGAGIDNNRSTASPMLAALLALAGIVTLAASRQTRSHRST